MKRFISYLYEYGQGRKIQNIGFAKAELKDSEGRIQIHGKGIRLPGQGKVKVYLCYEQDGECVGIFQGELKVTEPAVDYRLLYTTVDTGGQEIYDRIAGIILKAGDERTYAALWGEKLIDPEQMTDQNEIPDKKEIFSNPEESVEQKEEEEIAKAKEEPEEEPEKIEPEETAEAVPEEKDLSDVDRPELEVSDIEEAENTSVTEQVQEEVKEERKEEIREEHEEPEKILHEMECEELVVEPQIVYEKITREDIAKLPRCEWGIANNTFLLHGYRNYHHLLLIEDRGQLWLGVPGVYHEREQIAASSCGFPRFWRIPADQIGLSEEERNDCEDFGYWCRKVRRRRP